MRKIVVFISILAMLLYSDFIQVFADDALVTKAKSLSAKQFDETLPAQSVEEWLRMHLPAEYGIVWGQYITDCGESTGSPLDKERDMPLCAEVEIRKGTALAGYLASFVGTQERGLMHDYAGLYFGYLEHQGIQYSFRKLSDILNVERTHNQSN